MNRIFRKSHLLLSLLLVSIPLSSAWSSDYCKKLLRLDAQALAGLKPGTVVRHRYTRAIPLTPVRNQCEYGGCWVYANMGELESLVKRTHKRDIDLSEQYLLILSLRLRALDALQYPGELVSQGGTVSDAYWLVENYGLVPNRAWKPRIPFENGEHAKRLMYFLNTRIAKFHLESDSITDEAEFSRLLKQAEKEVLELIEVYSGPLPRAATADSPAIEFEFDGIKYTPLTFRDKFLPRPEGQVTMLFPERENLPPHLAKVARAGKPAFEPRIETTIAPTKWDRTLSADIEDIKKNIVSRLTPSAENPNPQPVWIGIEWVSAFIDSKTGVMSVDAFHTPAGFVPPSPAYRNSFGLAGGGHAVDIVDVELNPDGTAKTFLIRNSWSVENGDAGYYHMDVKGYFDHFFKYTYAVVPSVAETPALAGSELYEKVLQQYLKNHTGDRYQALNRHFVKQCTGAACSLASVTMILNAVKGTETALTQAQVLQLSNNSLWKRAVSESGDGLQLEQLGEVLRQALPELGMPGAQVEVVHLTEATAAEVEKLRRAFIGHESSDKEFIILNFDQRKYIGEGDAPVGHFSVLGAYDRSNDAVLVMDPDSEVAGPYFARLRVVFDGMNTKDAESGKYRGYIRITKP